METWTIRRLLQWSASWLGEKGIDSPRLDAELLLAQSLDTDRITLYLDPDRPLVPQELSAFKTLLKRRARCEPVAYILGRRDFWKDTFHVTPGVLIPRPESEGLLEALLSHHSDRDAAWRFLEIGTGSGAVLLSALREYPNAHGTGVDLSPTAVEITGDNAKRLGLLDRLTLFQGDLTAPLIQAGAGPFDAILCNPPYIATPELDGLEPEVSEFEPREALDGGRDGLTVLRRLPDACAPLLNAAGVLALEIGHRQGEAAAALLTEAGYQQVTVHPDHAGHPRIVTAIRSGGLD